MAPPISRVQRAITLRPEAAGSAVSPWSYIRRIRLQLGGAIVTCVMLPALVRWWVMDNQLAMANINPLGYAVVGTFGALVSGYILLRQFLTFPGVKATTYILPSFVVSYAAAAVVFFFLRIEYSRWQFAVSFILAIGWFYIIYILMRRYAQPRLALVPGGDERKVTQLEGAIWVRLNHRPSILFGFDGLVADLRASLAPEWERFLAHSVLNGWPVYDVKQVAESLTGRVEIEHLSENNFGSVLPSLIYLRLKRVVDFTFAIMLLPFFLPVILIASLCIVLDSPGPALFRQARMGFRARQFTCYKLRSMHIGIEGERFTVEGDPRITRIGHFLRKYRIDEFPQIFNILKGDMSWIGPRPEAAELAKWYESEVPFYAYRHAVRPGISGWAQVHQGNVAEVGAATVKLHYDFYYIKYFSPWLDLLIAAKTLHTILTGFERRGNRVVAHLPSRP
jgi:lipopolysaccharide/colanic/teichoic acid biosynthesis glycosyltransferase